MTPPSGILHEPADAKSDISDIPVEGFSSEATELSGVSDGIPTKLVVGSTDLTPVTGSTRKGESGLGKYRLSKELHIKSTKLEFSSYPTTSPESAGHDSP